MRLAILLVLACGVARAEATYDATPRAAHLRAALDAMAKLGPDARAALELQLYDLVRTKCRAGAKRPTTGCMIEVARAVCGGRADCLAIADVILTNQHAETDLIDDQTRMRLVRTTTDYHAAIEAELRGRYALLAAELALAPPAGDPAAQIDAFCAGRDRTVHACEPGAKACVPSIAYQRCAAGLAWFVANQPEGAR